MTSEYKGKFGSYGEAFNVYEQGKHRRYSLLFAVNGGAVAIVNLYDKNGLGSLRPSAVAVGVIVFTILMSYDIWIFGSRMRVDVDDDVGDTDRGIFSRTGKQVLTVCCGLLVVGWGLVLRPDRISGVTGMSLEQWSWVAAIVGTLVALVGFPLLSWQLFITNSQRRDAIRLSRSQVLLAADAVLATHAEVAANLRGGWDGNINPTVEQLPLVEPYLGVFERIFVAYREGQIDSETLDQLYGYRISNIWNNRRIVEMKLQNEHLKTSWKRIIALTYVIEAQRGKRFPLHTDTYFPKELFDRRTARGIRRKLLPSAETN